MRADGGPRDTQFVAATIQVFTFHQELRQTRFSRCQAVESPEFAFLSVYRQCRIDNNEQSAWSCGISTTWNHGIGATDQNRQRSFPGRPAKRYRNISPGNFVCAGTHDSIHQLAQQRSVFLGCLQHAVRVDFQTVAGLQYLIRSTIRELQLTRLAAENETDIEQIECFESGIDQFSDR